MVILAHIKEQSRLSLCSYSWPRVTEEMKELGLNIGPSRVGHLIRENGIRVERSKSYKVTTDGNPACNFAPTLLNRYFIADAPNQKWAGDISYMWTPEGWPYFAFVGKTMPHIVFSSCSFLNLHSRRVIGWAVINSEKSELAIRALKLAVALREPPKGCIHHTDRGSQYCSHDYQKPLRQHGFKVSMSGRDNCYDNSAASRWANSPLDCFLFLLTFFKMITAN